MCSVKNNCGDCGMMSDIGFCRVCDWFGVELNSREWEEVMQEEGGNTRCFASPVPMELNKEDYFDILDMIDYVSDYNMGSDLITLKKKILNCIDRI